MKRILLWTGLLMLVASPALADPAATVDAYWRGDFRRAFEEFHKLADEGHTVAQAYLAVMYQLGQGTFVSESFRDAWKERNDRFRPGDYERVLDYVRRADRAVTRRNGVGAATASARRNRGRARIALDRPGSFVERGHAYYLGLGVPQDYVEAAKWYYKAARRGDPAAQGCLGIMYIWGHGVLEDAVAAYKWLTLALTNAPRDPDRRRYRAIREQLGGIMAPEDREIGEREAREFRPVAE